jgi:hypothetical protein
MANNDSQETTSDFGNSRRAVADLIRDLESRHGVQRLLDMGVSMRLLEAYHLLRKAEHADSIPAQASCDA